MKVDLLIHTLCALCFNDDENSRCWKFSYLDLLLVNPSITSLKREVLKFVGLELLGRVRLNWSLAIYVVGFKRLASKSFFC